MCIVYPYICMYRVRSPLSEPQIGHETCAWKNKNKINKPTKKKEEKNLCTFYFFCSLLLLYSSAYIELSWNEKKLSFIWFYSMYWIYFGFLVDKLLASIFFLYLMKSIEMVVKVLLFEPTLQRQVLYASFADNK